MILVCFVVIVLSLEAFVADDTLKESNCTTPYEEEGICVPIPKCAVLLSAFEIIPNQAFELLEDSKCGCDSGNVCCGPSIKKTYQQRLNCEPVPKPNITIASISEPTTCGFDQLDSSDRIQGGISTVFGEFPWLAAIESTSKIKNDSAAIRCGGSILNNRYIMTAAHCIAHHEFVATRVWLGATNIGPQGNCLTINSTLTCMDSSVKKMKIQEVFVHPDYNNLDKINDIGLVLVEHSIEYSKYIRPICLPSPDSEMPRLGIYMTVAGWGSGEYEGIGSMLKLKVNLPVQDPTKCNTFFNKGITAAQLCVGGDRGKDSCQGDSGGPLMSEFNNVNGNTQWYQEGVVSYGYGCGRKGRPAVYTRVASYVKWMTKIIETPI